MHALMGAVLLRAARLDEFGMDAELDPPHREAREPREAGTGEIGSRTATDTDADTRPLPP
jgi:hypothetical protein